MVRKTTIPTKLKLKTKELQKKKLPIPAKADPKGPRAKKPNTKQATKTKKLSQSTQIRVPRTTGLTELSRAHQRDPQSVTKEQLYNHILQRYIADGFRLFGIQVDINTLSTLFQMPLQRVIKYITKANQHLAGLVNNEDIQDTTRALLGSVITGALADRGRIMAQADMLDREQDGQYVPFLTSTYNSLLKTLLESHKPILDVAKLLTPQGPNIQIDNHNGDKNQENYLTVNEAAVMLDKAEPASLLEDPSQKADIQETHLPDIEGLPEVVATKQQGVDKMADGLRLQKAKYEGHDDRREADGEIQA